MKTLLITLFLGLSLTAWSQTDQGTLLVSGGAGLQFSSSNVRAVYDGVTNTKTTVNSFTVLPSAAYFVIPNLAVGLNGNITSTTVVDEDGDKNRTSLALLIPSALYFIPLQGQVRPVLQAGAGLASQTAKYIPDDPDDDTFTATASGLVINAGAGLAIFLNQWISANFGLSYTSLKLTDRDDTNAVVREGSIGGNFGFSLYLLQK